MLSCVTYSRLFSGVVFISFVERTICMLKIEIILKILNMNTRQGQKKRYSRFDSALSVPYCVDVT